MITSVSRQTEVPSKISNQLQNNVKDCINSQTGRERTNRTSLERPNGTGRDRPNGTKRERTNRPSKSLPTSPKISNNNYKDETSHLLLNVTSIVTGTASHNQDDLEVGKRCQRKRTNKTLASGSSPYRYRDGSSIVSDLCPKSWFSRPPSTQHNQCCNHVCCTRWSWKLCFLCFCLPMCYPCYLSKTYRRRWRHSSRLRPDLKSNSCPNLVTGGQEFDVSMSRQGSGTTSSQSRLQGSEEEQKNTPDQIELDVMILHSTTSNQVIEKLIQMNFLTFDASGGKTKVRIDPPPKRPVNVIDKLERYQQESGVIKLKSILESPITEESEAFGDDSPVVRRKEMMSPCGESQTKIRLKSDVNLEKDEEEENIFKVPEIPQKMEEQEEEMSTPGSFYSGAATPRHGPLRSYGSITSADTDAFFSIESGIDKLANLSKNPDQHRALSQSPSIASATSLRYPSNAADRRFERYYSVMSEGGMGRSSETHPPLLSHRSYDSSQPSTDRSDRFYSCQSSLFSYRLEDTLDKEPESKNTPPEKAPSQIENTPAQLEKEIMPQNTPQEESVTMTREKSSVTFTPETSKSSQEKPQETRFLETHFGPGSLDLSSSNNVSSVPVIEVELANSTKRCLKSDCLHIKQLGWRSEEVAGLKLKLNLMTEPDLTSLKTGDIKEFASTQLPSVDIIVTVWRGEDELKDMMDKEKGVLSYIKKYWTGFFLFLLIEVEPDPLAATYLLDPIIDAENKKDDCPSSPERETFRKAQSVFGDCHRIVIRESDLETGNLSFVTESMARFFSHSKLFNCARFGGSGMENLSLTNPDWTCPDLCQLRTTAPPVEIRKKVRLGFFKSVRRAMTIKRGSSRRTPGGSAPSPPLRSRRGRKLASRVSNLEAERENRSSLLADVGETPPTSVIANGIDNPIKEKKPLESFSEVEEKRG